MIKTDIIKLREAEASVVNRNGDYKISLDRPIKLNQGDQLAIKSVYLDTISAGGQLLEIDEDTEITMEAAKYIVNFGKDQLYPDGSGMKFYQPTPTGGQRGAGEVGVNGDNSIYFAATHANTTAATEKVIKVEYNVKSRANRMVGGLDLKFQYTRVDGTTGSKTLRIKREKGTFYPKDGKEFDIGVLCQNESFVLVSPDRKSLEKHWIDPESIKVKYDSVKPGAGTAVAELITKELKFTIEQGIYTPTELASLITDKMTKINSSGAIGNDYANGVFPVNNPFLSTIGQMVRETGDAASTLIFVKEDGSRLMRYNDFEAGGRAQTTSNDRFCGASQVALQYDDEHKKMSFSILHTPIYVNESSSGTGNDGQPGLLYDTIGLVDKYSGIAFTSLQSSPDGFWNNLGLEGATIEYNSLAATIASNGAVAGGGAGISAAILPFSVSVEEGDNITGGFKSLDTPVQKNTNYNKPNPTGEVSSDATLPILGDKTFLNNYGNEGYYLIELSMGLNQSLTGGNGDISFNSNKIHGIVGTYFQSNSYTSDTGAGSIPYIHNGEETNLSDIGVRILDANGQVVDSSILGDDNTIFLELIKREVVATQK